MSVNHPDRWAEVFDMKVADALPAFLDGWEQVRYLRGWEPLNLAIARARHEPLAVVHTEPGGYAEFINIAYQLQFAMGDQPILLPVHELAPKLEVSPMTITRYRTHAVKQGYLKIVRHHKHVPGGKGEATRFHFVGKRSQKKNGLWMLHNES